MVSQHARYAFAAAAVVGLAVFACTPGPGAGGPATPGPGGGTPGPGATAGTGGTAGSSETASCMTCHGDKTELGEKVQNAREMWSWSVHAKGLHVPLVDNNGTDSMTIGYEFEGSDAFYGKVNGCQVCHTKEGFNKNVSGVYPALPEFSLAHYQSDAAVKDSVLAPSSLTCFTCHKPHTNGNFDLVYPASKSVKMFSGVEYTKPKGSICVACHQARVAIKSAEDLSIDAIKATSATSKGMSFRHGPHYSGQGDLLMGKKGAEYGQTYNNGTHTSLPDANCITCHMTQPAGSGWSPNIGGHSFNVTGIVHGGEKGNVTGCKTCHSKMTAPLVGAKDKIQPKGFLKNGKAYFSLGDKSTEHYSTINDLVMTLVNPDDSYKGLLLSAYQLPELAGSTGSISFESNFHPSSLSDGLYEASPSATSRRVRFAKAFYNYNYFVYDGSFGVHNPRYLAQLLHDSCTDLKDLLSTSTPSVSSAANCGTRP